MTISSRDFPMINYSSWEEAEAAIMASPEIQKEITMHQKTFYTINVHDAMTNLTQVGDLLQIAYSASKGHACCPKINGMLTQYKTLVGDSYIACSTFVQTTLTALKAHRMALMLAEKKKAPEAMKILTSTAKQADAMAGVSAALVEKAAALCKKADEAFEAAESDNTLSVQKKAEIKALKAKLHAEKSKLDKLTSDLAEAVAEEKEKEAQAEREAKDMRDKAFVVSIISAVMKPIGEAGGAVLGAKSGAVFMQKMAGDSASADMSAMLKEMSVKKESASASLKDIKRQIAMKKSELEDEKDPAKVRAIKKEMAGLEADLEAAVSAVESGNAAVKQIREDMDKAVKGCEDRQAAITQSRAALQKQQRAANSELAEAVSKLAGTQEQLDDLDKAIASLEVAIKTLGKIVIVFENTRLYWEGVKKHCESLSSVQLLEAAAQFSDLDEDLQKSFVNEIKGSGLSWLALGRINQTAARAMEGVKGKIDHILTTLPSKMEAIEMVKNLSADMLEQIKDQDKLLAKK